MNQATASPAAIEPDDACLLAEITLKFAGDSGDGIQLAGQQFAQLASAAGERVRTLPDFPAEIRSPVGTLGGVSGFQVRAGGEQVLTPGDRLDLLLPLTMDLSLFDSLDNRELRDHIERAGSTRMPSAPRTWARPGSPPTRWKTARCARTGCSRCRWACSPATR